MLHFDLNVSILLKEHPFLDRFDRAAELRFDAVEFWWPAGEDLQTVAQRIRDTSLDLSALLTVLEVLSNHELPVP